MISFTVKPHSLLTDTTITMVEAWRDGVFVAGIYGHEYVVRLVSKYLDGVDEETGRPPSVVVKLKEMDTL